MSKYMINNDVSKSKYKGDSSISNNFMLFFNSIIIAALFFVMAQALIVDNDSLMTIAVILTIVYCLLSKAENIFYVLCGMTMFESVFKVSGDIVWFVPLLILVFKLLIKDGFRINSIAVTSLMIIFSLELILDFSNGSMGQLLVNLVTVIFVFVVFSKINILKINAFSIVFVLTMAFSAVVYYLLSMYGGMGGFISSFMSSVYAYRFGHSYGDTIGGAMAIPLYTTMLVSCGLSCYMRSIHLKISQKFLIIIAVIISIVFGAMTISRSFYLGLIVTLISILFFRSSENKKIKRFIVIFAVIALLFLLFSESDVIKKVLSNLQLRLDNGMEKGSGGRTDIWISCIEYLLEHPLRLLFGMGATNYISIGSATGELFAAGAHNLIIDFIMSWGIIGTSVLLIFLVNIYKQQKLNNNKFNYQSVIPLITYAFFAMTALRSCSLKTWMFF